MAEAAAPPAPSLFAQLAGNNTVQTAINNVQQRLGNTTGPVDETWSIEDMSLDVEILQSIAVTSLNGSAELTEQKVNVEYLKNEAKMVVPVPLSIAVIGPVNIGVLQPLKERYWKVATMPYAVLKDLANNLVAYSAIRAQVDALEAEPQDNPPANFFYSVAFTASDGTIDDEATASVVYGNISRALGFNCDLRDTGMLYNAQMRMSDDAWRNVPTMELSRLDGKLRGYTLQCIASLNLTSVGGYEPAAWVRAHALSAGILPSATSKCKVEWKYTSKHPTKADWTKCTSYEANTLIDHRTVSLNFIALFGILHLAKDHTFKSNDGDMSRICNAYLSCLRTMVPDAVLESYKSHMEAMCRTASHPFGLGQTYCVALLMAKHERLAKPLAIRINITPPPVQRLMIVKAAVNEWRTVDAGQQLNVIHAKEVRTVCEEADKVYADAPAYSGLHKLYGIATMKTISPEAKNDADVMMPLVYGYAQSQHVDENERRDGLALALSLRNVVRDMASLSSMFKSMWDKYMETMEGMGLIQLAADTRKRMVEQQQAAMPALA